MRPSPETEQRWQALCERLRREVGAVRLCVEPVPLTEGWIGYLELRDDRGRPVCEHMVSEDSLIAVIERLEQLYQWEATSDGGSDSGHSDG